MADVSTTDSTQTTEAVTPAVAQPSSTTEQASTSETTNGGTLLTGSDTTEQDSGDGEPAAWAAFHGAPEADSAYELTGLPEGTEIDAASLAVITPIAKELNLSNEGLSKIAGVYAEHVLPSVVERVQSELENNITATRAEWETQAKEQLKTDPAFEGKSLDVVRAMSAKTLDRFGGKEFREYLDETGLGNHPAMLKMAYLVGTQIAEDTTFERGGANTTPKSSVEKFYGAT